MIRDESHLTWRYRFTTWGGCAMAMIDLVLIATARTFPVYVYLLFGLVTAAAVAALNAPRLSRRGQVLSSSALLLLSLLLAYWPHTGRKVLIRRIWSLEEGMPAETVEATLHYAPITLPESGGTSQDRDGGAAEEADPGDRLVSYEFESGIGGLDFVHVRYRHGEAVAFFLDTD